jgi:aspartyl-tRNA(Asn)/glutamyl-tRNA(Gln) amidotransferase subunit C
MAKFSKEEVNKVAGLARIGVGEAEKAELTTSLSSILEFVDALQAVDTKGVVPTSQVTGLEDVLREDEVVRCELTRDELLANAPATHAGYIKVKRVLQ